MHELAALLSGFAMGLGIGVSLRSLVEFAIRIQRERREPQEIP